MELAGGKYEIYKVLSVNWKIRNGKWEIEIEIEKGVAITIGHVQSGSHSLTSSGQVRTDTIVDRGFNLDLDLDSY